MQAHAMEELVSTMMDVSAFKLMNSPINNKTLIIQLNKMINDTAYYTMLEKLAFSFRWLRLGADT